MLREIHQKVTRVCTDLFLNKMCEPYTGLLDTNSLQAFLQRFTNLEFIRLTSLGLRCLLTLIFACMVDWTLHCHSLLTYPVWRSPAKEITKDQLSQRVKVVSDARVETSIKSVVFTIIVKCFVLVGQNLAGH